MRVIACLLLALFVSSAFLGVCRGAVWFEGNNPQEPQKIQLNMQHIKEPAENTQTSLPEVTLLLSETEPHIVNLTITVYTMALLHQTGNFETWLSIDSQEPEKIVGILDSRGSAAGELYKCQYNVNLSGLGDGAHFTKIRVAGDYYGPGPEGSNYNCEGNVTFIIDDQTTPLPNPTQTPTVPELQTWAIPLLLGLMLATAGLLVYHKKHKIKTA
jgi:hypothetical protein